MDHTPYRPQTYSQVLDDTPGPPLMAEATACSGNMDHGTSPLLPLTEQTPLSIRDYMDFMKRARWKISQQSGECPTTGR
jgi:hypothetical protein